jgi:hypothetical protein
MHERRLMSFWGAVAVLAVTAVVALLLGAEPLHNKAETSAPSTLRTVALALTGPLANASEFLHFDWPRQRVAYGTSSPTTETDAQGAVSQTSASSAAGTGNPPTSTTTTLLRGAAPTATTSTTTATTPAIPVFTKVHPLRVLVVGDSLVGPVGYALQRRSDAYPALQVKVICKVSSGLVRPDFFDWPKVMAKAVADFRPLVTVVLFGGNEKQPMHDNGRVLQPFSDGWNAQYALRVKQAVELNTAAGSRVVWIGLPIMRSSKFSETARTLNAFYVEACAEHKGAVYIDGYQLFSDGDGKYSPYLEDSAGKTRLMRAGDGIHFSNAGGDRAAEAVMQALLASYRLQ